MLIDYMKSGAKWISAPKPMLLDSLFDVDLSKATPRNDEPAFDAANVLRFGHDLIYLVSATGNEMGGHWLQSILGDKFRVHFLKDVYYGSHIAMAKCARSDRRPHGWPLASRRGRTALMSFRPMSEMATSRPQRAAFRDCAQWRISKVSHHIPCVTPSAAWQATSAFPS